MARERYLVDGFDLTEGVVRDVELREGLNATAGLIGENGVVPNRSGEVWRPKRRGPSSFTLNMWTGTETGRADVDALYDLLIRAFGDGLRLPLWTRYLADGTVRQTFGEVVSGLSPQPIGQAAYRLAVEVRVPTGIWESTVDAVHDTTTRPASGTQIVLTEFAGVTAPMERLSYRITGPATNPRITDATSGIGDWFQYNGSIPNGGVLYVNSDDWTLAADNFTPNREAFFYSGPRFMTLRTPMPGGTPAVIFDYANGGTTTRLSVQGRLAFAI